MGIYEREYYRSDGPSFLGSFAQRGYMCKWLIGINVVAFILQYLSRQGSFGDLPVLGHFTETFWLSVPEVMDWQVWRLLTCAFLHDTGHILHLIINMLCLWWFGNEVEGLYGRAEFLAMYLVSAVVASLAFVLAYYAGLSKGLYAVGASGAVMAVMVLYALHFPKRTILLFFVLPVPAWFAIVLFIGMDLFGLVSRDESQRIAFSAHLAGAAFAFLYYKSQVRFTDWFGRLQGWRRQRSRPRLRLYYEEERRTPVHAMSHRAELDEQLEAKMDAVLQKVQDHGIDSLTPTERQILLQASEAYKRRRQ